MNQTSEVIGQRSDEVPVRLAPSFPSVKLCLPQFESTEEAVQFGQTITLNQFIFLAGARAALQREFKEAGVYDRGSQQRRVYLATKIQLIRECLEAAPTWILASVIGRGIFTETAP